MVTGWGLDDDELDQAEGRTIKLASGQTGGAALPAGIATVRWSSSVPEGTALTVRGSTTGLPVGTVVRLSAPGAAGDSARTAADSTFALSVRPAAEGRFEYVVSAGPSHAGAAADTIGVAVTRARPPALLILDASPSFESRYLEDWLRQRGGSMALRTEVSRNRYRTRFLNRPTAELTPLSPELLRAFDLVLLDGRTLRGLPAGEQRMLTAAASAGTRGRAGGRCCAAARDSSLRRTSARTGERRRSLEPRDVGNGVGPGPGGSRTAPLAADDETRVLATDSAGAAVAAWRRRGGGAVAVSLVLTPSRWRLSGERELFAAYWSRLIGTVARTPEVRWEVSEPARVDAPMQLVREGTDSGEAVAIEAPDGSRDPLYLAQDPVRSGTRWEGATGRVPRAGTA